MTEDNFDDITDDGEGPVEEPIVDPTTSLKGEIIPDDLKVKPADVIDEDEPSKPVEAEPEPVQPPEGTEEPSPEVNPYDQKFQELGLDRQFPGGIADMLSRQRETNKYISDLEAQRNALRDQQATPKPEPVQAPSDEDLVNSPVAVINQMLESRIQTVQETVNQRLDNAQLERFVESKSDFHDMEPFMAEAFRDHPELIALGTKAVPVLYKMAKATQLSRAKATPPTRTEPVPDKGSAQTSTGKKITTPDINDPEYWRDKSPEEIEKIVGYRD